jgi:hypothetical protein
MPEWSIVAAKIVNWQTTMKISVFGLWAIIDLARIKGRESFSASHNGMCWWMEPRWPNPRQGVLDENPCIDSRCPGDLPHARISSTV